MDHFRIEIVSRFHWGERELVDSTDALSRYIDIYIDVRTFTDTAHAHLISLANLIYVVTQHGNEVTTL